MKKSSFFTSFLLATVTIAGCSSVQMSKPAFKTEITHEIQNDTIDLGGNLKNQVKLKLGFSGFSTKSLVSGFGSSGGLPATLNNSKLEIKLHKYPSGTPQISIPAPKDRFESGTEVFSYPLININTATPLTIKGLQENYDYYLSARLYLDYVTLPNDIVNVNTTSGSNSVTFAIGESEASIRIGDYVQIGLDPTEYKVVNSTAGGFFVSPNVINTSTNETIKVKRDIVAIGDSGFNATGGKGMALNGSFSGGGTIPAKTTGALNDLEEYISINNQGIATINNDSGIIDQLDMNIQLMQDLPLTYRNNSLITVTQDPTPIIDLSSYYFPTEIDKIGSITFATPQKKPTVTISDTGDINLVWESNDGTTDDIKLRNYVDSTKTWSAETLVNTTITGNQINPSISSDELANSVVVWTDKNSTPSSINFQRYSSLSVPIGVNEIYADSTFNRDFAKIGVSRINGKKFIITWAQDENFNATPDTDVYAQIFNNNGTPFGIAFKVNTNNSTGTQKPSCVSVDDNGNFLISWIDLNTSNSYFRLYDSSGVPKPIISLTDAMGISDAPKHGFDSFGNFIVVGRQSLGIYAQKFDNNGQRVGNRVYVDNTIGSFPDNNEISIKVAKDGSSFVSWIGGTTNGKANFVPLTKDLEIDDYAKMINYSSNDLSVKTLNTSINETGDLFATWTVDHDPTIHPTNNQIFYRKFSKVRKKY